jgi:8-oxo-dGTP diphosphatase
MRIRSGCILIENEKVALIERHRAGLHYFTFPGGGVAEGESHEQAAVREMEEETGLQVKIVCRIADVHFHKNLQPFFLVERLTGEFGTGSGEEYGEYDPVHGSYHPVWMSVSEILSNKVVPRALAKIVLLSVIEGWPEETVIILENKN